MGPLLAEARGGSLAPELATCAVRGSRAVARTQPYDLVPRHNRYINKNRFDEGTVSGLSPYNEVSD